MAKPVATSASAPARADSRRCSHMPSPTSPAPNTAPNATRAGGVNQPREAARASKRTTPSSVTAPPVQASSRAPVSGDRFGTAGAAAPKSRAAGPRAIPRAVRPQADRRAEVLGPPMRPAASPARVRARPGPPRTPGQPFRPGTQPTTRRPRPKAPPTTTIPRRLPRARRPEPDRRDPTLQPLHPAARPSALRARTGGLPQPCRHAASSARRPCRRAAARSAPSSAASAVSGSGDGAVVMSG